MWGKGCIGKLFKGERILLDEKLRLRKSLEEWFGGLFFGMGFFRGEVIDKAMIGGPFRVEGSIEVVGVVSRLIFLPPLGGLVQSSEMGVPGYGDMPDEHFIGST